MLPPTSTPWMPLRLPVVAGEDAGLDGSCCRGAKQGRSAVVEVLGRGAVRDRLPLPEKMKLDLATILPLPDLMKMGVVVLLVGSDHRIRASLEMSRTTVMAAVLDDGGGAPDLMLRQSMELGAPVV
ncbi:hypothetical protein ACLOJK_003304 [Asimina triloba]